MKKYICITTMDQKYYDHCGLACIESFSSKWPKEVDMFVYNENIKKLPKLKRVFFNDWKNLGDEYNKFIERHSEEKSHVTKFAKKAYSIIHALKNADAEKVIWLDADTFTTFDVSIDFLDLIAPDDVLSTHFGVEHDWPSETNPNRKSFSCETGFFIVNKKHPMFREFIDRYEQYYNEDLSDNIRRFYDGEVYGAVIAEMIKKGALVKDLNRDHSIKTPIPRSVLAPYITHFKAGRKDSVNNEELLKNKKQKIDEN